MYSMKFNVSIIFLSICCVLSHLTPLIILYGSFSYLDSEAQSGLINCRNTSEKCLGPHSGSLPLAGCKHTNIYCKNGNVNSGKLVYRLPLSMGFLPGQQFRGRNALISAPGLI